MKKRFFSYFHFSLFSIVIFFCIVGIFNLYSAAYKSSSSLYMAQIYWMLIGFGVMMVLVFLDYRIFERLAYPLYAFGILMLILVLIFGPKIYGARRWIDIGLFRIQSSELMKIGMALALAKYFHDDHRVGGYTLLQLLIPSSLLGLAVILIMIEPDLGSALLLCFIGFSIFLFVKVRWQSLVVIAIVGALSLPIAYEFVLKDYQRDRVKTFLNPSRDPRGKGYHALQSIIAVGSGRLDGKGHRKGTQTQLAFLPEQHTDFVFSVFAEEHGFIGVLILLIAYASFLFMGLDISKHARDKFGAVLALGLTSIFFWQVLVNIGMVMGVMPVVGITLPFMSYGGSSIIISMAAVGFLLSIHLRRFIF